MSLHFCILKEHVDNIRRRFDELARQGSRQLSNDQLLPRARGASRVVSGVLGQSPIPFHVQIPFKSTKLDTNREAPLKSVDIAKTAKLPQSLLSNRHHDS